MAKEPGQDGAHLAQLGGSSDQWLLSACWIYGCLGKHSSSTTKSMALPG